MHRTTKERLKRIQEALGVEPDGVLGSQTLSALERRLLPRQSLTSSATPPAVSPADIPESQGLTLSQSGIQLIIDHEIGSESYYRQRLSHPVWPGGESGVTIGIGYDLGYCSQAQFVQDWGSLLRATDIAKLKRVCGRKGKRAKRLVANLRTVTIALETAKQVFINTSLPTYANKTLRAFPGVEQLKPDAQAALVSLVYNRGTSISGNSRREMATIKTLVPQKRYDAIAQQIKNMKRLWAGRGLDGLLRRRDDEARMVAGADRNYRPSELVQVA